MAKLSIEWILILVEKKNVTQQTTLRFVQQYAI